MKALRNILVIPAAVITWAICDWLTMWLVTWLMDFSTLAQIILFFTLGSMVVMFATGMTILPALIAANRVWGGCAAAATALILRVGLIIYLPEDVVGRGTYIVVLVIIAILTTLTTLGFVIRRD